MRGDEIRRVSSIAMFVISPPGYGVPATSTGFLQNLIDCPAFLGRGPTAVGDGCAWLQVSYEWT